MVFLSDSFVDFYNEASSIVVMRWKKRIEQRGDGMCKGRS
jgi:hypothetical protein